MTNSQSLFVWQTASHFLHKQPVPFCMTNSQSLFVWQTASPFCMSNSQVPFSHRNVVAGRSSVSHQMTSVFLSDNISLFTNFAWAGDVTATSLSKRPMKRLYIMYVNDMLILIFGLWCDVYKIVYQNRIPHVEDIDETFVLTSRWRRSGQYKSDFYRNFWSQMVADTLWRL